MSAVDPATLPITIDDSGVEVTYDDGRTVRYRGVPQAREESVTVSAHRRVHVLATDADGETGALVYLTDRRTHHAVLEESGVGRYLPEETPQTILPGVTARREGSQLDIGADPDAVAGRVFVFVEDDRTEQSYELLAA
ncbi:DUF5796 family protein [Halococcoides cellulosivorans]|uniref:Uncharacterized protein n=1 Tax=Halococcoides cellulosivorans TaxID=1679096 RepID=A0A2R4WZC4_9EURY|nr:DUF5796 family protein [Halococcoides cellulosivorans]AWB26888.1 hypothetical protein HARCEL1_03750 [Halococcoides cellulosivorans]